MCLKFLKHTGHLPPLSEYPPLEKGSSVFELLTLLDAKRVDPGTGRPLLSAPGTVASLLVSDGASALPPSRLLARSVFT